MAPWARELGCIISAQFAGLPALLGAVGARCEADRGLTANRCDADTRLARDWRRASDSGLVRDPRKPKKKRQPSTVPEKRQLTLRAMKMRT